MANSSRECLKTSICWETCCNCNSAISFPFWNKSMLNVSIQTSPQLIRHFLQLRNQHYYKNHIIILYAHNTWRFVVVSQGFPISSPSLFNFPLRWSTPQFLKLPLPWPSSLLMKLTQCSPWISKNMTILLPPPKI